MSEQKTETFVSALLDWARNNLRKYPWRETSNPYRIMIAEIMLQRTRAEQVVPVYKQFLHAYPNISSLSKASVSEVRSAILSLGLVKRAEGIKRLADQIMEEYHGRIPRTREGLMQLHWVGNYIANAVLCYAFQQDVPTVDVNFARVLERVFSLKLKQPAQKDKRVHEFAQHLIPPAKGSCRVLNLGILDLANKICTAKNPSCLICPVNSACDYGREVLKRLKALRPPVTISRKI
jgi:A/G-specific adenine glycosylase